VKLSVVIPAHNEAGSIASTAQALFAELNRQGIEHEILAVNDHSTDQTEAILQDLALSVPTLRYLNNSHPNGVGLAVRKGLECRSGDAVAFYLAVGSDDPKDLVHY
jgi:dolichol-phosphate mannosyltransferase